eukprot:scaffold33_cov135-Pinguiococcus_pyrenoidosus.AAC.10
MSARPIPFLPPQRPEKPSPYRLTPRLSYYFAEPCCTHQTLPSSPSGYFTPQQAGLSLLGL